MFFSVFSKMGRKGSEISQDVRTVIVDLYKNEHKVCNITKMLNLPCMTVSNIVKRFCAVVLLKTNQEVAGQNLTAKGSFR
jgi:hypothetical protein